LFQLGGCLSAGELLGSDEGPENRYFTQEPGEQRVRTLRDGLDGIDPDDQLNEVALQSRDLAGGCEAQGGHELVDNQIELVKRHPFQVRPSEDEDIVRSAER